MAISILIIYFNIGLPSALKGFLFFIQVLCMGIYVYVHGIMWIV